MDITIENVLVSVADKRHKDFEHLMETILECNTKVNVYATKGTAKVLSEFGVRVKEVLLKGPTTRGNLRYKLGDGKTLGFRKTDVTIDFAVVEPKPLGKVLYEKKQKGEIIKPDSPVLDIGGINILLYATEATKSVALARSSEYMFFIREIKETKGVVKDNIREYYNGIARSAVVGFINESELYRALIWGK